VAPTIVQESKRVIHSILKVDFDRAGPGYCKVVKVRTSVTLWTSVKVSKLGVLLDRGINTLT
jgi:hypothetical protein